MAWINLVRLDALYPNDATPVTFDNTDYAVFDTANGFTVSENRCTHAGAALCDGYFDGNNIECPLHQGLFDATSGLALAAPVIHPLKMFPSRVAGDWLQIKTD